VKETSDNLSKTGNNKALYLLSSWKEYGIKLATYGTFKIWNLPKCINIQWSMLTIYTYERA
jgi:hypothetical protein